jgi:pimeloyl-ACP methyl ester carboxylesterase
LEGPPLVLLHGNLSTIEVDFGRVLPALARTRRVVGVEQQAHGHTADVDRPLSFAQMADDTAALLRQLGIEQADLFGYSTGAAVALRLGIERPELVRKLVLASISYHLDGLHPGILAGVHGRGVPGGAGAGGGLTGDRRADPVGPTRRPRRCCWTSGATGLSRPGPPV